ncbi:unnamed protein product [Effrenium voratum]|nr:unnamed protein product [Effrenium voratum]
MPLEELVPKDCSLAGTRAQCEDAEAKSVRLMQRAAQRWQNSDSQETYVNVLEQELAESEGPATPRRIRRSAVAALSPLCKGNGMLASRGGELPAFNDLQARLRSLVLACLDGLDLTDSPLGTSAAVLAGRRAEICRSSSSVRAQWPAKSSGFDYRQSVLPAQLGHQQAHLLVLQACVWMTTRGSANGQSATWLQTVSRRHTLEDGQHVQACPIGTASSAVGVLMAMNKKLQLSGRSTVGANTAKGRTNADFAVHVRTARWRNVARSPRVPSVGVCLGVVMAAHDMAAVRRSETGVALATEKNKSASLYFAHKGKQ